MTFHLESSPSCIYVEDDRLTPFEGVESTFPPTIKGNVVAFNFFHTAL